jgi:ligand-binding sensor domain-containing protein
MASVKASRANLSGSWVLALFVLAARAEQLPIRSYGPADGFPSKTVEAITTDSRGFLWFSTWEGLAQYDGYGFRTYSRVDGLPRDSVADFIETRSGIYWAATAEGVAKFDPSAPARKKFTVYRPAQSEAQNVHVLYEDRSGKVWCGTEGGLFLLNKRPDNNGWRTDPVPLVLESGKIPADQRVFSLFEDSHENLWVGTVAALYLRRPNGRVTEFQVPPREGYDFLWNTIFEDPEGRLWTGTGFGLWRILPNGPQQYKPVPVFVPKKRLIVWSIMNHPGGGLWLGSSGGLIHWKPAADGLSGQTQIFTEANGLSHKDVGSLARDRDENLWLGTNGGGAMRLARNGFVTYTDADGISLAGNGEPVPFSDRSGNVNLTFHRVINVRKDDKFSRIRPAIPIPPNGYLGWASHQSTLQDKSGDWWFATGTGVVRFPNVPLERLSRTPPRTVYTSRDGLATSDIFRIFEDSGGGIWISCIGPLRLNGVSRRDRGSGKFQHFSPHNSSPASAFAEDREHSIWIGHYDGALGRYRQGEFSYYGIEDGLAGGAILALHVDRTSRLWIASTRGLTRVDLAALGRPQFHAFTTLNGLSSNITRCLAEDRWGRIYVSTGRGIDRIDETAEITPAKVHHYTETDGLTKGDLNDIMFDRSGDLWCTSKLGVSRFTPPDTGSSRSSLPILIRGLRIRGVPYPLSELGETSVPRLTLAPLQNQLQVDFSTLAFNRDEPIKYQYRLDPADADWSDPSDQRAVNLSEVSPGSYRFRVRTVTAGVVDSEQQATLDFIILAPVWERWWFRFIAAVLILSVIYSLHYYRTLQVLALERVRTRIATDLHDDIGSSLSQIAILSEVARRGSNGEQSDQAESLSDIGAISRELVDSMSDIVWSIDPVQDTLRDLVHRMRRFAGDVLLASEIVLDFSVPCEGLDNELRADVRRQALLIFKEAIHNIVRHSHATRVQVVVELERGWLLFRLSDNGCGFDPLYPWDGHGLNSMRERARLLNAGLEIRSELGAGSKILLRVPVRRRASFCSINLHKWAGTKP